MSTVAFDLTDPQREVVQPAVITGQRSWRLSRLTVGILAGVLLLADLFWVTALHGAVGSLERTSTSPLNRWLRDSLIMLPLYVAAVWAALRLTQRWVGRRRELVRLATALALAVVFTTIAGLGFTSVTAWVDYNRQVDHLEQVHAGHTVVGACVGLCSAKQDTLDAHLRGIGLTTVLLVVSNVILGMWVLALRGGRLWQRRTLRPATTS